MCSAMARTGCIMLFMLRRRIRILLFQLRAT
jgi:hypothetical protein